MTAQTVEARPTTTYVQPIIERLELPVRHLTHADVLRVFDLLRRRVSVAVSGHEGAFAGIDNLVLDDLAGLDQGRVRFSALLVRTDCRRHVVAVEASVAPSSLPDTTSFRVARGTGCTVSTLR
jgi:hypothetical protein